MSDKKRKNKTAANGGTFGNQESKAGDSILDYIATLKMKDSLYTDVYTAVSVLRSLSNLGKNIVMRLLWLDNPVPDNVFKSWVRTSSQGLNQRGYMPSEALRSALERLTRLNVLIRTRGGEWHIEPRFKASLRKFVRNDAPDVGEGELAPAKKTVETATIEEHARRCWERILGLLIDESGIGRWGDEKEIEGIRQILIESGFMDDLGQRITPKGFRFLFLPHRKQVWSFLLGYVKYISRQNKSLSEDLVLRLLFMLSHLSLGQDYPMKSLSEPQKKVISHLVVFGFVYQRKKTSKRYFPTALALSLSCSEDSLVGTLGNTHGKIITETTFRITAYTSSAFQIAILNKFARLDYRLPNSVVGVVTKHSVMEALRNGINAAGIVMYLEQYAHPQMKRDPKTGKALPVAFKEQIYLWEKERQRFSVQKSCFLHEFASTVEFKSLLEFAREEGILQWFNERKQWMTVDGSAAEKIKEFRQKTRS
ncbi:hypothetical protein AAMO2058_000215500 [Amorphochlora amoebiformis]